MSVTWAFPAALLLLIVVPLHLVLARRRADPVPMPRTAKLARSRVTSILGGLPRVLRTLTLLALVTAIAGPSTPGALIEESGEGIHIVLAVDISSSMLAQDFLPRDRLEVAKGTIGRFVASRDRDALGLVGFAAEALTLVPTTTHRPVLLSAIESLEVGLLEDGTAIGDGLATAVNRLRHLERGSPVVVLLSDGENNRGTIDPLAAAAAASTLGIRVFTVGVGSEGVVRVPIGTAPAGFRYAELPVGLDEELLREIASQTGGEYFRANDPAALEAIYEEIDRRLPTTIETTRRTERVDWSAFFLLIASVCLLAEWAIRASRWGTIP